MGLPPSGFTMGKSALRIRTVLFAASSTGSLQGTQYSRPAGASNTRAMTRGVTRAVRRFGGPSLARRVRRALESRFHVEEDHGKEEQEERAKTNRAGRAGPHVYSPKPDTAADSRGGAPNPARFSR